MVRCRSQIAAFVNVFTIAGSLFAWQGVAFAATHEETPAPAHPGACIAILVIGDASDPQAYANAYLRVYIEHPRTDGYIDVKPARDGIAALLSSNGITPNTSPDGSYFLSVYAYWQFITGFQWEYESYSDLPSRGCEAGTWVATVHLEPPR